MNRAPRGSSNQTLRTFCRGSAIVCDSRAAAVVDQHPEIMKKWLRAIAIGFFIHVNIAQNPSTPAYVLSRAQVRRDSLTSGRS